MVKGSGMVPDFKDMDEDTAYAMLTTGSEVMRMLRDGDSNSTDERARSIYAKLLAGDSP
jgi:hypothetical protein